MNFTVVINAINCDYCVDHWENYIVKSNEKSSSVGRELTPSFWQFGLVLWCTTECRWSVPMSQQTKLKRNLIGQKKFSVKVPLRFVPLCRSFEWRTRFCWARFPSKWKPENDTYCDAPVWSLHRFLISTTWTRLNIEQSRNGTRKSNGYYRKYRPHRSHHHGIGEITRQCISISEMEKTACQILQFGKPLHKDFSFVFSPAPFYTPLSQRFCFLVCLITHTVKPNP